MVRSSQVVSERTIPLQAKAFAPAAVALIAVVGALGASVVRHPELAVAVLIGGTFLTIVLLRVEWALLLYVAAEPFGDQLIAISGSAMKGIGLVLFASWLVRLAVTDRMPSLRHPALVAAGALVLVLFASTVASMHGSGLEVLIRYLSYLGVLVVLVDTMRNGLDPRRVMAAFVLACGAASVVGLVAFLNSGGGRAAGPMGDANDFAFYLICAVPFAWLLWTTGSGRGRHLYAVVGVLLLVTTLATFSRGALLGLTAIVIVALVTRLVRVRALVAGAAAVLAGVLLVLVVNPSLLERSLAEKQYVADANVSSRFTTWVMAAEMTADSPLLGQGPGGYRANAEQYVADDVADTAHVEVPHQMYLDVSSELGLLGLAAFLTMMGAAVLGGLRALRHPTRSGVAAACLASFAGIAVAATFLSEQYYLPLWLLVAIGAAIDPVHARDLSAGPAGRAPIQLAPRSLLKEMA